MPRPTVGEDLQADYLRVGTTLGPHPLALLRDELKARRCRSSRELLEVEHGRPVSIAGLVTGRQRPGTASSDAEHIAALEREVRELRRTNQILKSAASFFAAELDRPSR